MGMSAVARLAGGRVTATGKEQASASAAYLPTKLSLFCSHTESPFLKLNGPPRVARNWKKKLRPIVQKWVITL
jgi:hypothetical protein